MQISFGRKQNDPHSKYWLATMYVPHPQFNTKILAWLYRKHVLWLCIEDTFTVCKQCFSTAKNPTLVNL